MSHVDLDNEENVIQSTDNEKEKNAPPPNPGDDSLYKKTCDECFHQSVCYFFLKLTGTAKEFKDSGLVAFPFNPNVLANGCKKYLKETDAMKAIRSDT